MGPGRGFTVMDIAIDQPKGREVLVEVKASGLCHTDLTVSEADFGLPFPAVLGHEVAGIVLQVGPEVTDIGIGDHVVACLIQFCGRCIACLDGRTFECTNPGATLRAPDALPRLSGQDGPIFQFVGIGGFAEQVLVHENQLAVVNKTIPFPQAAVLGCGTVTGAGAVINSAQVRPRDSVAVFGTGGVGLNAINAARLSGASVIVAVDLVDAKLERAKRFGATHVVNAGTTDPVEAIRAITGAGVDFAFEVIGLPATQQQAIEATRAGGTTILVGMGKPGASITLPTSMEMLFEHKTVKPVSMGSTHLKRDIPYYADMYVEGRLLLDEIVTQEIALDEIPAAYDQLKHGEGIRSVVTRF
ncbi:Zn-dependent alcohol dehydrogenase [Sphingomonadaceae bacterium jetA1]|jgi:S-(hydroxymethyl)glutathione dehydrogenase/alcohol dehydrogenase|uniref:zinc-binding dehydrogenase n=1 Tax=Facivitalis istanbulensis TaxID=3075838 RepID=UPI00348A62D8